jgi:hypothetical protein
MNYFWLGDTDRDYTSHNETPNEQNAPNGNIYDTPQAMDETYPLQGMDGRYHIALIQRFALCAESFGPLTPRVSGALGTLALIGLNMMTRPLPDCSPDLAALSLSVRD